MQTFRSITACILCWHLKAGLNPNVVCWGLILIARLTREELCLYVALWPKPGGDMHDENFVVFFAFLLHILLFSFLKIFFGHCPTNFFWKNPIWICFSTRQLDVSHFTFFDQFCFSSCFIMEYKCSQLGKSSMHFYKFPPRFLLAWLIFFVGVCIFLLFWKKRKSARHCSA